MISIVVGSTGLVGKNLLLELSRKKTNVIALTRRPICDLPKNIKSIEIDFDSFLKDEIFPACDHIYICLGTTIKKAGSQKEFKKVDLDYCVAIAKKARKAGATKVSLVSSVGANPSSNNFYLKTKGEVEEAIKKIDFTVVNIYRPSLLIGSRHDSRFLEGIGQNFSNLINPFLLGSLKKYRSIKVQTLAACIANPKTSSGVSYFYFKDFFDNES